MKYEDIKPAQVCRRCVMNSTDTNLTFDENGICDRCREYEKQILPWWNHGMGHERELEKLLLDIKKSGEGMEYDCLLGLSGGLDSSYMLHLAVTKWGLRPFVFHIDTGWDLPVTVGRLVRQSEVFGIKPGQERNVWNQCI